MPEITANSCREAINHLDRIGTQASAISTLGELLYAVDFQSEHISQDTLNNLGCLLEVISSAMLDSAFSARGHLGAYAPINASNEVRHA